MEDPERPNYFAWHRKHLDRQAISAVANHWQFHMAYHAGQRMRAQVIMMVFQMLGESLANHWLFGAFDSLALRHHRCVVPFRASHLQVGAVFPLVNISSRTGTKAGWILLTHPIQTLESVSWPVC